MARYNNGINGPLSGTVGTVIAASWRGVYYLKGKQEASGKPPSEAQLKQRRVLSLVSSWLRPLKDLINIGYQVIKEGKTPMNEAISFVMKEAVLHNEEEMVIDFAKVVFSRGELLISIVKEIVSLVDVVLHIKWDDVLASAFCKDDDQATFIAYNPAKEQFVTFDQAALRADKEALLQLPAEFAGDTLHCYMHYVNAKGDAVSTGQYLGEVLI